MSLNNPEIIPPTVHGIIIFHETSPCYQKWWFISLRVPPTNVVTLEVRAETHEF